MLHAQININIHTNTLMYLRRYWNRDLWSRIYITLLNPIEVLTHEGTDNVEYSLSSCIAMLTSYLNRNGESGISKRKVVLHRLVSMMKAYRNQSSSTTTKKRKKK